MEFETKSTETQRHFLQQVDPVVRKAIANPKSFIQELRDRDMDDITPVQREAMVEGVRKVFGSLRKLLESTKGYTKDEIQLVGETVSALCETNAEKVPLKWVRLLQEDPAKALEILEEAEETIEIASDLAKLGLSGISEYTTPVKQK